MRCVFEDGVGFSLHYLILLFLFTVCWWFFCFALFVFFRLLGYS